MATTVTGMFSNIRYCAIVWLLAFFVREHVTLSIESWLVAMFL